MTTKRYRVLCQKWDESERGWGCKPWGYTLHLTDDNRQQFIDDYWANMPNSTPDWYIRPEGKPYWCEVDELVYKKIHASKYGDWDWSFEHSPCPHGDDGWRPLLCDDCDIEERRKSE